MEKSFELRKAKSENIFTKIAGIIFSCYVGYFTLISKSDMGKLKFFPIFLFFVSVYLLVTHGFRLKTEKNKHNKQVNYNKEKTREQLNDYLIERAEEDADDVTLHKLALKADEIIKSNDADKV